VSAKDKLLLLLHAENIVQTFLDI